MVSKEHPFERLVSVIDTLLGPDGCPWDREQTVLSLSRMLLEEACETLDAINDPHVESLAGELGDLFFTALFLAKCAEKETRFVWTLPFEKAVEKLVRRHPHIFGTGSGVRTAKEVEEQWDVIKATEPEHSERKSRFDGIAKSLPALAMVQKLIQKARKSAPLQATAEELIKTPRQNAEEELGRKMACLVLEAEKSGIPAEEALRRFFIACRDKLVEEENVL
ncbi:MAG: hypothetical protein M1305_01595 [Candidatus Marsarchaeota archaeon]|nr:hypothetical protein [Candidatus Marsarchaeota archaeon]